MVVCVCRRGKIIYTNPTTNETMLWNLFMNNSTVDVTVSTNAPFFTLLILIAVLKICYEKFVQLKAKRSYAGWYTAADCRTNLHAFLFKEMMCFAYLICISDSIQVILFAMINIKWVDSIY